MPKAANSRPASSTKNNPLWRGPEVDGVTSSLLSRFLVCRERFRLLTVKGLRPVDEWNHRTEYGSMWHVCEEEYARSGPSDNWAFALVEYTKGLVSRYRTQQADIEHWYQVCKTQFPIYLDYWRKHPDVKKRKNITSEVPFKVPYTLPNGTVVQLRGMLDSLDLIDKALYIQENKTKGDIVEQQLKEQLTFDLQTMIYITATHVMQKEQIPPFKDGVIAKLGGVRYNVIRRPLSGGRHSIRQHQPTKSNPEGESKAAYYSRLAGLIASEPEYFFMRWRVEITLSDIHVFQKQFLDPMLTQLCEWWNWISSPAGLQDPFADPIHWRTPYGFYNPLAEGRRTDLDEYMATGSMLGLEQVKTLFPELE